jgi:hypothetical protein
MWELSQALVYTGIAPLLAAVAAAWIGRWLMPQALAERYGLGIALAAGFFSGYWLLPNDWAPLVPARHWHWLAYLPAAGVPSLWCAGLGGGL